MGSRRVTILIINMPVRSTVSMLAQDYHCREVLVRGSTEYNRYIGTGTELQLLPTCIIAPSPMLLGENDFEMTDGLKLARQC